jgi:hypothetical protein
MGRIASLSFSRGTGAPLQVPLRVNRVDIVMSALMSAIHKTGLTLVAAWRPL